MRHVSDLLMRSLILTALLCAGPASAANDDANVASGYVPNELLVKFKSDAPTAQVADAERALGARQLRAFSRIGVRQLRLGQGMSVEHALAILANPGHARFLEYAEPNYVVYASDLPNDPRFGDLYGLNNIGQTGGTPDADIDAPEAWAAENVGAQDVLVGVIDSGIDYTHPDLAGKIWTNPGEIAGNGIDDDGDGYVDDVHGWDFVNSDNDPMDDNGHGTHVSGTIAAVRNNSIGVAGVAAAVKLIPLKFLGSAGSGSSANAIAAIDYATRVGARITSNSWGGGSKSRALQDAIAASTALFVAAAGNAASSTKEYPAGYDDAKIISVAATDNKDALASFSNYGATWVDLAAPGVNILSTLPNQSYGLLSGTSMATPHVAGAAAFVMAQYPTDSVASIKSRILTNVDVVSTLQGKVLTNGRLNLARAVGLDPLPPGSDAIAPDAVTPFNATATTYHSVSLSWNATGDDHITGTAAAYDIRYVAGNMLTDSNWTTATQVTGEPSPLPPGGAESLLIDNLDANTTYGFGIKALDEAGNASPLASTSATTPTGPWSIENVGTDAWTYRELDYNATNDPGVGYEDSFGNVRYAYRNGAGAWQSEQVDGNGKAGLNNAGTSFRFAPDGAPSMSYAQNALKFARKTASGWVTEIVQSRDVYDFTSLAFDANGYPAISYRTTGSSPSLKFARKSATGWRTETVDVGATARYNSLAFDTSGNPVIAYSHDADGDNTLDTLKLARWNGTTWIISTVETGVVGYGVFVSLAIDTLGRLGVAHSNSSVRYVEIDGTTKTVQTVAVGSYSTLAFDGDVPQIAYATAGQTWVATRQTDGSWQLELVDITGGGRTVIRVDATGAPTVLYNAHPAGLDLARKNQ